jgi:sec-independent protein translocase protein TatB
MFDLGWAEMAVIMLVALVVIGPKDLPKVARTIGQWTGKARALARDFQRSLDDMAREAELDEIKKSISSVRSTSVRKVIKDAVDPDDELERAFDVEADQRPDKPRAASNVKKASAPAANPALAASGSDKEQTAKAPASQEAADEPASSRS